MYKESKNKKELGKNMIKERISQLLDKEMDRKSFLVHVAAGAVAIVGTSTAVRTLTNGTGIGGGTIPSGAQTKGAQTFAYGGSPYGK